MKTLFSAFLVFLATGFAIPAAHALEPGGLFIEPLLSYQRGTVDINYAAPFSDSEEDIDGFGLGARVGVHIYESVFLALDGRYSFLNFDSSALNDEVDANSYDGSAVLGVQTPIAGLRVWAGYIFAGGIDPDEANSVDVKFTELQGYRLGLGLYVRSFSVNLEYEKADYDNTKIENAGPFTGDVNGIDADTQKYILSLSFPVSI